MKLATAFGFLLFSLGALAAPRPVYERQSDSTSTELLLLNLDDGFVDAKNLNQNQVNGLNEATNDYSNKVNGLTQAAFDFLTILSEMLAKSAGHMKQRDLPMLSTIEAALRERADGTGDEPIEFERGGELTFNVTDWAITAPLYATFYTLPFSRSLLPIEISGWRKEDYDTTVVPVASDGCATVPSHLGNIGLVLVSTNATVANPASILKRDAGIAAAGLWMWIPR